MLCGINRAYDVGARDEALQAAIDSGTDWLKRSQEALASIDIPFSITRWDDWRLHPEYQAVHKEHLLASKALPIFRTPNYFRACSALSL